MKAQNFLQKESNVNLAMNKEHLEELINEETRRLVGYIMPILEGASLNDIQRSSIKKILYTYKNNLCTMLINEMSNNEKNKSSF